VQTDKSSGGQPDDDAGKSDEELQGEYRKIAERRVRLGLVLAEIGRAANVQITEQELSEAARQEAMRYGPQAQEVFDYLRKNPQAQAQLRAPIYEDKVVDLIFSQAKVEDKPVSKDELMEDDELPESYGGEAKPAKKAAPKKAAKAEAKEDASKAEAKAKPAAKAKVEAAPTEKPAKPKAAPKAK
jgi:trigger factor